MVSSGFSIMAEKYPMFITNEEAQTCSSAVYNTFASMLQSVPSKDFYLIAVTGVSLFLTVRLAAYLEKMKHAFEKALDNNPDVALARMQAAQRARERQQKEIVEFRPIKSCGR